MVKDIAFTAYSAEDVAALRAFYEQHLGLKFSEPYSEDGTEKYAEANVGAGCFAVMTKEWLEISPCGGVAFEVDDIAKMLSELAKQGVSTEEVHDLPACRIASFTDPEGNKVTLHQSTLPH